VTESGMSQQVTIEPKHALRRHLTGRYHTGLIPVATLVQAHYLQGQPHSHSDEPEPIRTGSEPGTSRSGH
jgi:hypothetical protein